jgi:hypothetical protein
MTRKRVPQVLDRIRFQRDRRPVCGSAASRHWANILAKIQALARFIRTFGQEHQLTQQFDKASAQLLCGLAVLDAF